MEYVIDFNATRAYKEVYNVKKEKVAQAAGSRMLSNVIILKRLHEILTELFGDMKVRVTSILKDLEMVKLKCLHDPNGFNPQAVIRAMELQAKIQGLLVKEQETPNDSEEKLVLILPENNREVKKAKKKRSKK